MKKAIIFLISLLFLHISCFAEEKEEPSILSKLPNRIVSISPAITEILYELGLGDKVVGVTEHCNFPEDVKDKFRIGGYLNINYEAMIFLRPDLVIGPSEYSGDIRNLFDSAEIAYMTVNTQTINGIFNSIKEIGRRNGVEDKAEKIVARMCKDIVRLRKKVKRKSSRRIMVVVGRDKGTFENLYIAGKGTFYEELLNILGCKNVYSKGDISYPTLSLEGILRLNPDIIIEMLPGCPEEEKPKIRAEWKSLKDVDAVKNNKVYVFSDDYVCIPGPRFTLILKDIANIL